MKTYFAGSAKQSKEKTQIKQHKLNNIEWNWPRMKDILVWNLEEPLFDVYVSLFIVSIQSQWTAVAVTAEAPDFIDNDRVMWQNSRWQKIWLPWHSSSA